MIVAELSDDYEMVTQVDHAHLAAELLSLLRVPELVEHPRRDRLLRATREHDNGWWEADAAPRVDPASSVPLGFRDVDAELRREIWSRGCERWRGDDPYVALLITLHAVWLHRDRRGGAEWSEWLQELDALSSDLLDETRLAPTEARADHAWLGLADAWSLAVCERRSGFFQAAGFAARTDGDTLRLEPFPLAGATTFELSCRRLPRVAYGTDRELGRALATSAWTRRRISVAP